MLSVVILSVIMLSVAMLSVIMLNVTYKPFMLIVIMLSVVMLSKACSSGVLNRAFDFRTDGREIGLDLTANRHFTVWHSA